MTTKEIAEQIVQNHKNMGPVGITEQLLSALIAKAETDAKREVLEELLGDDSVHLDTSHGSGGGTVEVYIVPKFVIDRLTNQK